MPDRTLEVVLKLTTGQFKTATQTAQQSVTALGAAMSRAVQRGAEPLAARIAAATAATNTYRAALRTGKSALEAETSAAQAATRAVDALGQSRQRAVKTAQAITANLADLYNAWMGVEKGIRAVVGAVNEFIAVGERAAQRERAARMFEMLSGSAVQATENLRAMREATNYTISEAEAMEGAIGLLGMRLANTPQQLAQITQQVATLGKQFAGFSAERSIQQFMFAVENQSLQRLGEFGLNITDVTRRVEEFTRAGYDAREAFKMAVLEGLDEQFQRIGGATVDAKTAFEQYRAAVDDLTAEFEAAFLPVAEKVVVKLTEIIALSQKALVGGSGAEAMVASVESAMARAARNPIVPFAKRDMADVRNEIIATAQTQEELNAGLEAYYRKMDEYVNRYSQMPGLHKALVEQPGYAQERLSIDQGEFVRLAVERAQAVAAQERQAARERAAAEREAMLAREEAIRDVGRQIAVAEREIADRRDAVLAEFARETEDIERRRGRDALLAALRAGWALEDAERQTAQRRAEIQQEYEQARAQAAAQFAQAQAQAAQQYARQMQTIERQYQQRLADIRRQYEMDEFEATLARDAAALFRARRRRDDETAKAARDRADQEQRAGQQYQNALQQAQQTYAQSLAQAERARAESLAQLEQALREELEARRRAEERARIEQRMQLQWQEEDRQMYLQRRILQVSAAFQAELEMARQHYEALRAMEAAARGSAYIPGGVGGGSSGARPEAFAAGGYTSGGLALLHAGEFVMSPQTTRQLEGAVGGRLTQQNVVDRGVTVNATFSGVNSGDRAWIEQRLGDFSRELAGVLN
ncbi:MAG: hypothetical protein ACP5J4_11130 [Anaerolineae bacterium]